MRPAHTPIHPCVFGNRKGPSATNILAVTVSRLLVPKIRNESHQTVNRHRNKHVYPQVKHYRATEHWEHHTRNVMLYRRRDMAAHLLSILYYYCSCSMYAIQLNTTAHTQIA